MTPASPGHPTFTVIVNNVEYTTSAHTLTGLQIKELAGIPADYELFELKGSTTDPVSNTDEVHIHNKITFRAIPAGTFGGAAHAPR